MTVPQPNPIYKQVVDGLQGIQNQPEKLREVAQKARVSVDLLRSIANGGTTDSQTLQRIKNALDQLKH